jgi:hypothetical protein
MIFIRRLCIKNVRYSSKTQTMSQILETVNCNDATKTGIMYNLFLFSENAVEDCRFIGSYVILVNGDYYIADSI